MTNVRDNINLRYIFIALIILVVYGNTLNHGFVWDDHPVIEANPVLESLGNIPRYFVMEDIANGSTGYYRPMTYISFAIDHAVWGINPVGSNITNLILHVLVALVFYRVVAAVFKREDVAFAAAVLFALHPLTGETVNFHAGGRNTLLSAFFALLSLYYFVGEKRWAAVACFTAAIFSKEFALLMPAVFLLYETAVKRERPRWLGYLPYVAATAGYLGLRSYSVASNGNLLKAVNIADNFWIVPQTIVGYLTLMLNPFGVKTLYDVNNQVTWTSLGINTAMVLALVVLAVAFRKRLEILFGIFMFLLFLLPVTNILPLGVAMMADRYAYFALFGFALALAYCLCLMKRQATMAVLGVLCIAYAAVDVQRNSYWKDDVSLFTQVIKDAPLMSAGYQNLGYAYFRINNFPLTAEYLIQAQGKDKKDLTTTMLTSNALTLLELERPELALEALARAIQLDPNDPTAYVMAARVNEGMGNAQGGAWYRDRAAALVPGIFEVMEQKAATATAKSEAALSRNDFNKAQRLLYGALGYNPNYVPALLAMGGVFIHFEKPAVALHYFTEAVRRQPTNPQGYYKLSLTLDLLGKKDEARRAMDKFRELDRQRGPQAAQQTLP